MTPTHLARAVRDLAAKYRERANELRQSPPGAYHATDTFEQVANELEGLVGSKLPPGAKAPIAPKPRKRARCETMAKSRVKVIKEIELAATLL